METQLSADLKRRNRRLTWALLALITASMLFGLFYLRYFGFPTERVTIH